MVQRGHLEDALLAKFIGADLKDDRESFQYKDSTNKWQQQLLFDNDSDCAYGAP